MKKISIVVIAFVVIIVNQSFATVTLNQLKGKEHDFTNTYYNLSKNPTSVFDGQLVVLGDSFAFLFSEYADEQFSYVVHQGYNVEKIYKEFVPCIKDQTYKYAYILIGPNDFMEQTSLADFRQTLQLIIDTLTSKGMKVIMSDYCDPDYSSSYTQVLLGMGIPCFEYDRVIKELIIQNNLIYVEMSDLLAQYGRMEHDMVHPHETMYRPLFERLSFKIELINNVNIQSTSVAETTVLETVAETVVETITETSSAIIMNVDNSGPIKEIVEAEGSN